MRSKRYEESMIGKNILFERTCKVCGKKIYLVDVNRWGYKLKDKRSHLVYMCSYHCYRDFEKERYGWKKA